MDFVEIAKSWIISMNPTPKQEETADHRIKICNVCEERKEFNLGEVNLFYTCGACGCPLKKKIYSPGGPEACPLKKWKF